MTDFLALMDRVLNRSNYRSINEEYVQSLPPTHAEFEDQTIIDYEPHCYGHGYYDDPDETPFGIFPRGILESSNMLSSDVVTKLKVSDSEQLLALTYHRVYDDDFDAADKSYDDGYMIAHYTNLAEALKAICVPPFDFAPEVTKAATTEDDENYEIKMVKKYIALMKRTTILEVDCLGWDTTSSSSHTDKCLSAALLSLLMAFPNTRALRFHRLSTSSMEHSSLFANFPSPLPLPNVPDDSALVVLNGLEILCFDHCSALHPTDLSYLADCAIEHKVFPNLRHIKCYYCSGMSYPSVVAASQALNLVFDRFECSGWCWPQEAVNSKNRDIHY